MNLSKYIVIKTDFVGFHYWENSPDKFEFLKTPHRHKFYITAYKKVTHGNREIEFIDFKKRITEYVRNKYENQTFQSSCEMIAEDILKQFNCNKVYVFEDDENGGMVTKEW